MKKTSRFILHRLATLCLIAIVGCATLHGADNDACKLLTATDILKATGLTVANGTVSPPVPGILSECRWAASGTSEVILTLSDAQHAQITTKALEAAGGKNVPGLGSKAIGIKAPAIGAGAAFAVSVLDAKGGFGLTVSGKDVTLDRVIALAKVVESHR